MTKVENDLMMILVRLALLDSASTELSRPTGTTRQDGQREQNIRIASKSSSDILSATGKRAHDPKPI
jgi:hypothetical protein